MGNIRRFARLHAFVAFTVAIVTMLAALPGVADAHGTAHLGATFVSRCEFSHRANEDPIVMPGMHDMGMLHDFFGNVSTDADSTAGSLATGGTTCRRHNDRAAYWAPTLYQSGVPVPVIAVRAYYTAQGAAIARVATMPVGLKMIAGYDNHVAFACRKGMQPGVAQANPPTCGGHRTNFISIVTFPDCWNGVDLDSPDHMSHVAYHQGNGLCPVGFAVQLPRLILKFMYGRTSGGNAITVSTDMGTQGPPSTMHADFFNAWDNTELSTLVHNCLAARKQCGETAGGTPVGHRGT
ncbi:MAG: hypothetical protein JWL83_4055 [Actinomycetia bacterium]|nr:hypothetical protein [Actinomycetes bacterium]